MNSNTTIHYLGFCILLQGFTLFLVPLAGEETNQESGTKTFYLANGKELVLELPKLEPLSGQGKDSVIIVNLEQRFHFAMEQKFWSKEFAGFTWLKEGSQLVEPYFRITLSQDYNEEANSYGPAVAIFTFRATGLMLLCKLEAFIVETQSWQELGTLRLKGDASSDQFQLKAIIARIRLSDFRLAKNK